MPLDLTFSDLEMSNLKAQLKAHLVKQPSKAILLLHKVMWETNYITLQHYFFLRWVGGGVYCPNDLSCLSEAS